MFVCVACVFAWLVFFVLCVFGLFACLACLASLFVWLVCLASLFGGILKGMRKAMLKEIIPAKSPNRRGFRIQSGKSM